MHDFAAFIMRSLLTAVFAGALFAIIALKVPPFAFVSSAVVALVALRKGWPAGLMVALLAAAITWAGWQWLGSRPGLDFPLVYAFWPPLLIAAEVLRRTESQGWALLVVGLTAAALVLAMHLVVGDVVAFWHEWLKRAVASVPGATVRGFEDNDSLRLMNGLIAVVYGLGLMFSLLVARWMQALIFNPAAFGPEFRTLRLPRLMLPLVVAAVWGAGAWNKVLLQDLFMVSIMLYFFVGLAVIHGIIAVRKMPGGWAAPVYIALVYAPQYALSGLALLGALDGVMDFRARAAMR